MHSLTLLIPFLLWAVKAQISITLPWGTWESVQGGSGDAFWHIPNIRFGNDTRYNRFKGPVVPDPIPDPSTIMDNSYGPACKQIMVPSPCSSTPGAGQPIPRVPADSDSEDCLFLDVYVPKSVDISKPDTPVVVWFYGGAFIFGSKGGGAIFDTTNPFYLGQGLIAAVQKQFNDSNVIFVAGNYRLGAFGWLAGPTMQGQGLPNAGIYDQLAVLSWVQKYIHNLGGDNSSISAWGESAGASSIMHHLVQQDGQESPIFNRALLQSPAFEWQWDNSSDGPMEANFNFIAQSVGCGDGDGATKFACLQGADVADVANASATLWSNYGDRGLFPYGPAVDNISFPLLAPVALESGKFKKLDSLVVSHVFNESGTFTPPHTSTEQDFNTFVSNFVPEGIDQPVVDAVLLKYPSADYPDQFTRLSTTIRDVSFTCNTRYLYNAYANILNIPVYMMQYSALAKVFPEKDLARHASDLIPAFFYAGWDLKDFIKDKLCITNSIEIWFISSVIKTNAASYQTYLANYAVTGKPGGVWTSASNDSNFVTNVLDYCTEECQPDPNYSDTQNTWEYCGFWLEQAKTVQANVPKENIKMALASDNDVDQMEL